MSNFSVIDTETNWLDEVMSVGVAVADENFRLLEKRYYILDPAYRVGGMYGNSLYHLPPTAVCGRGQALSEIRALLSAYGADAIFAYHASFDFRHLPELASYSWYDIMRVAAYVQFNPKLDGRDCFRTGRLRHGADAESMIRLLTGDCGYEEKHNALSDAVDELELMRLLGCGREDYIEYVPQDRFFMRDSAYGAEEDGGGRG